MHWRVFISISDSGVLRIAIFERRETSINVPRRRTVADMGQS